MHTNEPAGVCVCIITGDIILSLTSSSFVGFCIFRSVCGSGGVEAFESLQGV